MKAKLHLRENPCDANAVGRMIQVVVKYYSVLLLDLTRKKVYGLKYQPSEKHSFFVL